MKKIHISLLLMLSLCPITMYAAQASPHDVEQGRQVMIDDAVKNFPYLTQGFDFLRTQNLVDTSFHEFLEQNVSHDEDGNEDMNFDQVIMNAEDIITKNMKHLFLQTLGTALQEYKNIDQFDDPVFLYVMQHKDYDMCDIVCLWLYEWSKATAKDRWCPLHRAICSNNVKIASMLIDAGADVNTLSNKIWTSLHLAVNGNQNYEIVQMLIAAGVNINIQSKFGQTPLHCAVLNDNAEIVEMLIAAGADVNNQDKYGETLLHCAVLNDNAEIVEMLIAAGADVNIKNKLGETAEQKANTPEMKAFFAQAREKQQEKADEQAMARFEKMIRKDWR